MGIGIVTTEPSGVETSREHEVSSLTMALC